MSLRRDSSSFIYVIISQLLDFTYLYNRLNIGIIFKVVDNRISVLCYRFIIFSNIINIKKTYSHKRHFIICCSAGYAFINFIKFQILLIQNIFCIDN